MIQRLRIKKITSFDIDLYDKHKMFISVIDSKDKMHTFAFYQTIVDYNGEYLSWETEEKSLNYKKEVETINK